MSKEQRDAIDAALRAAPFDLEQSVEEHRKMFDGFALQPYPADVSSHEVLLDDAVRLAAAAGRDDVDVTLRVAPEGTHVFQLYFGALDEADEALDEVARFFARHLG